MFSFFHKNKSVIWRVSSAQILKKPAVFLHTQKTAGTTIVTLVASFLGGEYVTSHGDFMDDDGFDPATKPFISGHFGYDYAEELINTRYSFTFLRDPADRILSFYYFCRQSNPDEFPVYKLAHELSLNEFLEEGLSGSLISNYIFKCCCLWIVCTKR